MHEGLWKKNQMLFDFESIQVIAFFILLIFFLTNVSKFITWKVCQEKKKVTLGSSPCSTRPILQAFFLFSHFIWLKCVSLPSQPANSSATWDIRAFRSGENNFLRFKRTIYETWQRFQWRSRRRRSSWLETLERSTSYYQNLQNSIAEHGRPWSSKCSSSIGRHSRQILNPIKWPAIVYCHGRQRNSLRCGGIHHQAPWEQKCLRQFD